MFRKHKLHKKTLTQRDLGDLGLPPVTSDFLESANGSYFGGRVGKRKKRKRKSASRLTSRQFDSLNQDVQRQQNWDTAKKKKREKTKTKKNTQAGVKL